MRDFLDDGRDPVESPPTPKCDANTLLDEMIVRLGLKNDAALAKALGVRPPVLSKIRHQVLQIGAPMLIRLHETTGLSIRDLRFLMGDHDDNFVNPARKLSK